MDEATWQRTKCEDNTKMGPDKLEYGIDSVDTGQDLMMGYSDHGK